MRLLAAFLRRFVKNGTLGVIDADGRQHRFGDGGAPAVTIKLNDRGLYRSLALRPDPVAGEAYMDGRLTLADGTLEEFMTLIAMNRDGMPGYLAGPMARRLARTIRFLHQYNPVRRARANASHHYDISNDFYRLFLDRDMQYSCAYFADPAATLEEAQAAKKRRIAAKLLLEPGMRVLDIGSGWGGLAFTLATLADVEVVGVTLSKEQQALASQRAEALGLAKRVRFDLIDYREVGERFDRIVSVGMFEHVGAPHYDAFFGKLRDLLSDDGVALLHSIGHHGPPTATGTWLRKYIFPGGYAPALSETLAAVERQRLWITDIELWRTHYAETLRNWHERFQANRERVRAMYDERFCRMWEFYLLGSEMAFRYGNSMVFQLQLARHRLAVPQTRAYIAAAEQAAAERMPVAAAG